MNGQCVACPPGSYYYAKSSICVYCGSGSTVDSQNQTCVKNNLTQCPQFAVFNPLSQSCECPNDLPFDNGVSCISCRLPMYWNP